MDRNLNNSFLFKACVDEVVQKDNENFMNNPYMKNVNVKLSKAIGESITTMK